MENEQSQTQGAKAPWVAFCRLAERSVICLRNLCVGFADYTVTYTTALGKATATVKATGSYKGTVTKNFIIKPAKVSGLKVTAGSKKATVAYKARKGAKYQIVCKPAFGKSKTVTTRTAKKTVTGLKAGTYKVSVRAYAKIGTETYYGSYAAKSVRVK